MIRLEKSKTSKRISPLGRSRREATRQLLRRFVGATLVLGVLVVPPAAAQEGGDHAVLLIMDASGSMNRVDDSGARLIDGAKGALREIVHRLPSDANVGLRVYGHRTSNDDPVAGCVDTELVVPVGPIDREALNAAIDSFDASGFTPIGLSLQEAANDLPESGARTIILVSDGVDTCAPPDPCEVAEDLAVAGFATKIHTVGFFLNDQAAVDQLQCIADVGHGTFTSVDSIDHFFEQLTGLVTGALEGPPHFVPSVQGALAREMAPVITWQESDIPRWIVAEGEGTINAGETRWFAFDVSHDLVPNGQVQAAANIDWQPDAGPDEYLEVQIYDEQGAAVGHPHRVLDIVVEFPQRLYLAQAAEYFDFNSTPHASAVTGPRSMFPSWEADSSWFGPARERFYEAGLNGGLYEMWRRAEPDDPLLPGRYYVAVTWASDRIAASRLGVRATMYPNDEGWRWERIVPTAWLLDLEAATATDPAVLELANWNGSPVGGSLGQPLRSIEVWAPLEAGAARDYQLELDEGERLYVAWHAAFAFLPGSGWGEGNIDLLVVHESGSGVGEADIEIPGMGYGQQTLWEAPWSGEYTITATLNPHDPWTDPAVALAFFVFAPDDTPSSVLAPDDAPFGGLPQSVIDALMAGLESVRQAVG